MPFGGWSAQKYTKAQIDGLRAPDDDFLTYTMMVRGLSAQSAVTNADLKRTQNGKNT